METYCSFSKRLESQNLVQSVTNHSEYAWIQKNTDDILIWGKIGGYITRRHDVMRNFLKQKGYISVQWYIPSTQN